MSEAINADRSTLGMTRASSEAPRFPVRTRVSSQDVSDFAAGAMLFGSGGGGEVLHGELLLRRALVDRDVEVVQAADLAADALVVHVGVAGGPDVLAERLMDPQDLAIATEAVVAHVGSRLAAVGIIEIGGVNALTGVLAAVQLGVPVIDGDLMGRAFPTITQTSLAVVGHPATPMALVGPAGDTALVTTASLAMAQSLMVSCVASMGGAAASALYPVRAAALAKAGIGQSLSACLHLGGLYNACATDDPRVLVEQLGGHLLIDGRIDELRQPVGRQPGSATITKRGAAARIDHHEEFLAVSIDGMTVAATPDLIVAIDPSNMSCLRTDQMRVGQPLVVFSMPALFAWPSSAEPVVGPSAFHLDLEMER